MKLLQEYVSIQDLEVITEASEGGCKSEKRIKVYGPMMEASVKNRNNRIYLRPILENAVKLYKEEYIDRKRSVGCLDHNQNDNPTVLMDRISHIVEDLHFKSEDDHKCYGTARIMGELPCGKIFATLVREGVLCGFSSRSLGQLNDKREVTECSILSIDAVISPSAPTAYIENVIDECREWNLDKQGNLVEQAVENLKNKVDKKYESKLAYNYLMEFLEDIKK